jgi:hypothetical protein
MSELEESIARELLTRNGIGVIWQAHVAADVAHRAGNDRAAEILLKIADAAEMIWRSESSCNALPTGPPRTSSPETDARMISPGGDPR